MEWLWCLSLFLSFYEKDQFCSFSVMPFNSIQLFQSIKNLQNETIAHMSAFLLLPNDQHMYACELMRATNRVESNTFDLTKKNWLFSIWKISSWFQQTIANCSHFKAKHCSNVLWPLCVRRACTNFFIQPAHDLFLYGQSTHRQQCWMLEFSTNNKIIVCILAEYKHQSSLRSFWTYLIQFNGSILDKSLLGSYRNATIWPHCDLVQSCKWSVIML